MITQELPGFFRIEAPLPGNPLKTLNAWLVLNSRRSLLVDTGFNMPDTKKALLGALDELGVNRHRLDVFITHLHSDHNGLTSEVTDSDSRVFCGAGDGAVINSSISNPDHWTDLLGNLGRHGFSGSDLQYLAQTHPGRVYANAEPIRFCHVSHGDTLAYEPYRFRVLIVPGHTPGHAVLYEEKCHFLISGDHILGSITPNITQWRNVPDSLGSYLQSLDAIDNLDVVVSYPGHRAVVMDTHKRIGELKRHHARRLAEVIEIMSNLGKANGIEVAARMSWDLKGSWDNYRIQQKCFAVGEAVAHLDHLVQRGELERSGDNSICYSTPGLNPGSVRPQAENS